VAVRGEFYRTIGKLLTEIRLIIVFMKHIAFFSLLFRNSLIKFARLKKSITVIFNGLTTTLKPNTNPT